MKTSKNDQISVTLHARVLITVSDSIGDENNRSTLCNRHFPNLTMFHFVKWGCNLNLKFLIEIHLKNLPKYSCRILSTTKTCMIKDKAKYVINFGKSNYVCNLLGTYWIKSQFLCVCDNTSNYIDKKKFKIFSKIERNPQTTRHFSIL